MQTKSFIFIIRTKGGSYFIYVVATLLQGVRSLKKIAKKGVGEIF